MKHILPLLLTLLLLAACNKSDPTYEALTSDEVKVVIDGGGENITCPYCDESIEPGKYHHHLSVSPDECPLDSCEYNQENHIHCFYNYDSTDPSCSTVCPGHSRGYGGMGGGSYN